MIESVRIDIKQLSNEENAILIANFIEEEVYEEIMQTEEHKATG
jgi:hypothetical protein